MEFVKFLGNIALYNKQIAVYRDGNMFVVSPETTDGNPVRYLIDTGDESEMDDDDGDSESSEAVWLTLGKQRMTAEQFEQFEERVSTGTLPGDARVVQRGLIALGYPGTAFECETACFGVA